MRPTTRRRSPSSTASTCGGVRCRRTSTARCPRSNEGIYNYMQGPSEFTITGTLKKYDATPFLKNVKVPVLFTVGEFDEADPPTVKRHVADDARCEVRGDSRTPRTSSSGTRPTRRTSVVRAFLKSVDSTHAQAVTSIRRDRDANRRVSFTLTLADFQEARARIAPHIKHTPLLTSRQLERATGFDVRLKAEMFQRVGSYKIRGPLNKFALMPEEQKRRGVVCSSAGNHAQGVALAAKIHGIRAVVCMATNATPAKIAATKGYGAEVVLHGNDLGRGEREGEGARAHRGAHLRPSVRRRAAHRGAGHARPRDRAGLAGGRRGRRADRRRRADLRRLDGGEEPQPERSASSASSRPTVRRCKQSVEAGQLETIDCRTIIDGLRVRRAGEINFSVVQRFVDEIVALPDREIFDAMIWVMERCKLVVEGAAAAPVAALLHGLVKLPPGSRVAVVLSGGNVNLDQLRGLKWNSISGFESRGRTFGGTTISRMPRKRPDTDLNFTQGARRRYNPDF